MKHLFLTSQVQYVAHSIGPKISDEIKKKSVFIITPIRNREHTDQELQWHFANKKSMEDNGFIFDVYDIAGKSEHNIQNDLAAYEAMYIEGGNPFYLLQESQKNNFGEYVKKRVDKGMMYISTSAGSIIAGPDVASVNRPGKLATSFELQGTKGFELVNFVIMPHWGDLKKKEEYVEHKIPNIYHEEYPHIILTDHQYVEVQDDYFKIIDVRTEEDE